MTAVRMAHWVSRSLLASCLVLAACGGSSGAPLSTGESSSGAGPSSSGLGSSGASSSGSSGSGSGASSSGSGDDNSVGPVGDDASPTPGDGG
jgi:hypothetical protein